MTRARNNFRDYLWLGLAELAEESNLPAGGALTDALMLPPTG